MTLIIIVLVLSIVVFVTAFVSPRRGSRAQWFSQKLLDKLLVRVKRLPNWAQTLIVKPPIASHKTIHKSADLGKAARQKSRKVKNKLT